MSLPLLVLLVAACGDKSAPAPAATAAPAVDPDVALRAETAAAVRAAMDPTVDPCTDFYRYACGGWEASTQIPADQAAWSRSFSVITERNREILKGLLEAAAADPGAGGTDPAAAGDWRRLGELYGSCMDEAGINAAGLAPVQPLLDEIEALPDLAHLPALLGRLQQNRVGGFWAFDVFGDLKNPDMNMAYLEQAGLGLPDRDYYLGEDEDSRKLQEAYRGYVARMLELSGVPAEASKTQAAAIYALEVRIAKVSLPKDQLRDPEKIYNPLDSQGLSQLSPTLRLPVWANAMGLPAESAISVHDKAWFTALGKELQQTDLAVIKSALRFQVLSGLADVLPDTWGDTKFEFYGKQVLGQAERKTRWKRCVDVANESLGEALGRQYVVRHFAGDSKEIALTMVGGIEGAFTAGLPGLSWMDEQTRQRAAEKAGTLTEKIGYPDAWLDTSTMAITAQPYAANALAAWRFHVARNAAKAGKPVDPAEWFMPPAMVNAYYNPLENEMVFPAGILQPPFFHRAYPAPMNYGAIGMVIGHELTHGFDDSGRKFDKDGRMTEWWAPEVATRFEAQAQCVDDQYDAFDAAGGLKVNGKLTLGENIADLGGVKLAWYAWKEHEKTQGAPAPLVEGISNDQLFYLAYAQGWCTLMSPELEKMLVTTNTHSPPRYRVNGPLMSSPEFQQVFQCEAGDAMVREPRCEVW